MDGVDGAVLITGGAGYLGRHVVRLLRAAGREVVVLDDLSTGRRDALDPEVRVVHGDAGDVALLEGLLAEVRVGAVVHLAQAARIGQSVADPSRSYATNLVSGLALLDLVRAHGVRAFVYASSAAVYGEPADLPIDEEHPLRPLSPCGETQAAFERALGWYHRAYGLRYAVLRTFNAAGALPDGTLGEDHDPETHLVPRLLRASRDGGPAVPIQGDDYPTTDGTCVRDYVHVADAAEGHRRALAALEKGDLEAGTFNLGGGEGYSVREVVDMVTKVTGVRPPTERTPRRAGDPPILVASAERAARRLGWKRAFPGLDPIVRSAWAWERRRAGTPAAPSS